MLFDLVIFSPPYAGQNSAPPQTDDTSGKNGRRLIGLRYSEDESNIGNLAYGDLDDV